MSHKKIKELRKLLDWSKGLFDETQTINLISALEKQLAQVSHRFKEGDSLRDQDSLEQLPLEIVSEKKGLAIFTDGACRGNPGPGSWATLGMEIGEGKLRSCFESSGVDVPTTNNRMEMSAVINALRLAHDHLIDNQQDLKFPLFLFSDSKYVLEGMEKWMPAWKMRGWKKADNKPPENIDLWQELDRLKNEFPHLKFIWVKGHAGHPQNERADELCNQALDQAGH